MDKQRRQIAVSQVADRLVIQLAHASVECFTKCAQSTRSVERLVTDTVEREMFEPFEREHFDTTPVVYRFAKVAILVDQSVGRPGEIVLERVARKLRQRAHAHPHRLQTIELLG